MTLMYFVFSNAAVKYYEWIVLLDFVTLLPNMLEISQKGLIQSIGVGVGGLIKYLWIGTFVWFMLSESTVCHYNGTVHSAQL